MENKFKRFLSLLIVLVMVVGMLPVSAFAAETEETVTVYFDNSTTQWETVYAAYGDSELTNVSYTQMTKGENDVWSVEIPVGNVQVLFANAASLTASYYGPYAIEDNKTYAPPVSTSVVAKIGDTEYETLAAAVSAAAAGDTINVVADSTETSQILISENLTIDLGGKTVNLVGLSIIDGAVTVSNGTLVGTSSSYSTVQVYTLLGQGTPSVTLNNVDVRSARHAVRVEGGSAEINGGTYVAAGSGTTHAVNVGGDYASTVVINSGTFVGPKGIGADSGSALQVQSNGTVTVNGGDFSKGLNSTVSVSGSLTINAGTFDQDISAYVADGSEMILADGVYTVASAAWYDPDATEYIIDSVEDMQAFAKEVTTNGNTFEGKTVTVVKDIDLAGINWTPIGTTTNYFRGTFDGGNHTISNMTIDVNTPEIDQFVGLFGAVKNAEIKNLTLKNVNITAVGKKVRAGALVGIADSEKSTPSVLALNFENIKVENCSITAEAASSTALVGGVVGYSYPANMKNISVSDLTIDAKASDSQEVRAAAILGYQCGQNISNNGNTRMAFTVDTFDVKNVNIKAEAYTVFTGGYAPYTYYGYITFKNGTIDGLKVVVDAHEAFVGGLVGYFWRSDKGHTVENVNITGMDFDVTTDYLGETRVGGMVGTSQSVVAYKDCSVAGTITERCSDPENPVNYHAKVGGFVGRAYTWAQTYTNCTADVDVTGSHVAGGFVGNHITNAQYTNCEAKGDVTANIAGGFAGRLTEHGYSTAVTFDGCKASGDVTGTNVAGGFIGSTADHGWAAWAAGNGTPYAKTVTLTDCEATGSVTSGTAYCAGVVGEAVMADGVELILDNVDYRVEPAYYPDDANVAIMVAQVVETKYKTLAEAVAAANAIEGGATVTMLADAEVSAVIEVTGNVTITGGKTITWADDYTGTLFNVAEGAALTVTNTTIDGENAFTFYDDTTTVEDGQSWYTRFVNVGEEDKPINANVITTAGTLTLGEGTKICSITIASDSDNGKTANTETGGYYLMYNDDLAVIYANGGEVNLNGAEISGNAGMILNAVKATTVMTDTVINGNMGCGNKGGIVLANGGTMTITGGSLSNNKAMARSATVLGVTSGAEVTVNTTIDGNKHLGVGSNTAGAIVVLEGASKFVMNGGSISNNAGGRAGAIASRWVGGSYGIHEDTSIQLNAGTITGNTASNDSWSSASVFLRSPAAIGEGMTIDGVIAVNAAPGALEITGGTFNGSLVVTDGLTASITGGTFGYDPTEWCAEGCTVEHDEEAGTWTVEQLPDLAHLSNGVFRGYDNFTVEDLQDCIDQMVELTNLYEGGGKEGEYDHIDITLLVEFAGNLSIPAFEYGDVTIYNYSYLDGTITVADGYVLVVDADADTATVQKVTGAAQNAQTGEVYETVSAALAEAKSGETVELLKDASEDTVIVKKGTTLDLNGKTLSVETYLVCVGDANVIDSIRTGLLKAEKDIVVLSESNKMLPVWDPNAEGYTFTQVVFADKDQGMGLTLDEANDTAVFKFVTFFRDTELLKDGASDNELKVIIRLTWSDKNGEHFQNFVYNDEQVSKIVTANGKEVFTLTLTGYQDLENLTFTAMVVSDAGAEFAGNVIAAN